MTAETEGMYWMDIQEIIKMPKTYSWLRKKKLILRLGRRLKRMNLNLKKEKKKVGMVILRMRVYSQHLVSFTNKKINFWLIELKTLMNLKYQDLITTNKTWKEDLKHIEILMSHKLQILQSTNFSVNNKSKYLRKMFHLTLVLCLIQLRFTLNEL